MMIKHSKIFLIVILSIVFLLTPAILLSIHFQGAYALGNTSWAALQPLKFAQPQPLLNGTPTVASYLPLINVEEYPTYVPTRTPTPTSTYYETWYGEGIYDSDHEGILYEGNWVDGEGTQAYLGTLKNSIRVGNEAIFHFEGRQVSIIYSADSDHGVVEIYIDEVLVDPLNQNNAEWYPQLQWDSTELPAGRHTLALRHYSGDVIDLDALIVSDYGYPPGPGVPPPYSTSYYMRTVDTSTMYQIGCGLGVDDYYMPGWQDNLVILDFGMPRDLGNGQYGASLFGLSPASTAQIAEAIYAVGYGYWLCSLEETRSQLQIGVGTSNYGSQVSYGHGQAWAEMVNAINSSFSNEGFINRVIAIGANDMELDWNSVSVTRAWVNGYDSVNQYPLYNFGDAGGCPSVFYPGWNCNNDWTLEDIWYISYGAPPSYPLPLIYADSGINAAQWHWIALYAYRQHGTSMYFQGEMTQWQSCLQVGGCGSLDNTPAEGWTFLWSYLNSDTRTAQDLRYSTDIMYYGY